MQVFQSPIRFSSIYYQIKLNTKHWILCIFWIFLSLGKCFEVLSVNAGSASSWLSDGSLFNFLAADTDLTFTGTDFVKNEVTYISTTYYPKVDQYRNGELIDESIEVYMKNDNSYGPSVGDSYGYPKSGVYTAGQFQTGDYLCLFPGEVVSLTADIWSNV